MVKNLFSYVVKYDSGFAPNPFYGICTLATCKPTIRKSANVGDWIVGTGSADKKIGRGGHLVHAMKVSEIISTSEYWNDTRFKKKQPNQNGSWMQASGDNIYAPQDDGKWNQLNSYHSNPDGTLHPRHVTRDTKIQRILVANEFVYFGGEGPKLPEWFQVNGELELVKSGIGYKRIHDATIIGEFESWLRALACQGFCGEPFDWLNRK